MAQWKALIEERRAKYAADKEREIEAQQQQSLLAEASAGKRQVGIVIQVLLWCTLDV